MKFNRKRQIWIIAIILVISALIWILKKPAGNFLRQANDSEVLEVLKGYGLAEASYYSEYKEFSSDEKKIGFSNTLKDLTVFFSKESIPSKYLEILPDSALPYVEKKSYRILICVEKKELGRIYFWTMDESQKAVKLEKSLEIFTNSQ